MLSDCFPQVHLSEGNRIPGPWLNVLLDQKFTCDALVTGYKLYAANTGTVFISIWAPEGATHMKLVWKTYSNVTTVGNNTFILNNTEHFAVRKGYFMGIHYPAGSQGQIIPYYDGSSAYITSLSETPYTVANLSGVYSRPVADPDLPVGNVKEIGIDIKRLAPVIFIMEGEYG